MISSRVYYLPSIKSLLLSSAQQLLMPHIIWFQTFHFRGNLECLSLLSYFVTNYPCVALNKHTRFVEAVHKAKEMGFDP